MSYFTTPKTRDARDADLVAAYLASRPVTRVPLRFRAYEQSDINKAILLGYRARPVRYLA